MDHIVINHENNSNELDINKKDVVFLKDINNDKNSDNTLVSEGIIDIIDECKKENDVIEKDTDNITLNEAINKSTDNEIKSINAESNGNSTNTTSEQNNEITSNDEDNHSAGHNDKESSEVISIIDNDKGKVSDIGLDNGDNKINKDEKILINNDNELVESKIESIKNKDEELVMKPCDLGNVDMITKDNNITIEINQPLQDKQNTIENNEGNNLDSNIEVNIDNGFEQQLKIKDEISKKDNDKEKESLSNIDTDKEIQNKELKNQDNINADNDKDLERVNNISDTNLDNENNLRELKNENDFVKECSIINEESVNIESKNPVSVFNSESTEENKNENNSQNKNVNINDNIGSLIEDQVLKSNISSTDNDDTEINIKRKEVIGEKGSFECEKISNNNTSPNNEKIEENNTSNEDIKVTENTNKSEKQIKNNISNEDIKIIENVNKNEKSKEDNLSSEEVEITENINKNKKLPEENSFNENVKKTENDNKNEKSTVNNASVNNDIIKEEKNNGELMNEDIIFKDENKINNDNVSKENKINDNNVSNENKINDNNVSNENKINDDNVSKENKINDDNVSNKNKINEDIVSNENRMNGDNICNENKKTVKDANDDTEKLTEGNISDEKIKTEENTYDSTEKLTEGNISDEKIKTEEDTNNSTEKLTEGNISDEKIKTEEDTNNSTEKLTEGNISDEKIKTVEDVNNDDVNEIENISKDNEKLTVNINNESVKLTEDVGSSEKNTKISGKFDNENELLPKDKDNFDKNVIKTENDNNENEKLSKVNTLEENVNIIEVNVEKLVDNNNNNSDDIFNAENKMLPKDNVNKEEIKKIEVINNDNKDESGDNLMNVKVENNNDEIKISILEISDNTNMISEKKELSNVTESSEMVISNNNNDKKLINNSEDESRPLILKSEDNKESKLMIEENTLFIDNESNNNLDDGKSTITQQEKVEIISIKIQPDSPYEESTIKTETCPLDSSFNKITMRGNEIKNSNESNDNYVTLGNVVVEKDEQKMKNKNIDEIFLDKKDYKISTEMIHSLENSYKKLDDYLLGMDKRHSKPKELSKTTSKTISKSNSKSNSKSTLKPSSKSTLKPSSKSTSKSNSKATSKPSSKPSSKLSLDLSPKSSIKSSNKLSSKLTSVKSTKTISSISKNSQNSLVKSKLTKKRELSHGKSKKSDDDGKIVLPLLDLKNSNITTLKSDSRRPSINKDKNSSSPLSTRSSKRRISLINNKNIDDDINSFSNYSKSIIYNKTGAKSADCKSDITSYSNVQSELDADEINLDSKEDTISVHIRIRPFNKNEIAKGRERAVFCEEDKQTVKINCPGGKQRSMIYHSICDSYYSQKQMFEELNIKKLLDSAIIGHHVTLFAFGQTGSGKTYTINGELSHPEYYGIMPRSFDYIYDQIKNNKDRKYSVKATYFEIYNEKIKDLLNPENKSLPVRWCKNRGFYVESLIEQKCDNFDECLKLLELGNSNKSIGKHLLNDYSSRSHCILTLNIYSVDIKDKSKLSIRQGKIHFVDLAGTEKVKESQTTGDSLVETMAINKSLLALGNCISALSDPKKRGGHIPYRDSKLTKILSESLSGKGLTVMISCISPSNNDIYETLKTLRYSSRAKHIKYKSVIQLNPDAAVIVNLKKTIASLQKENQMLKHYLTKYNLNNLNDNDAISNEEKEQLLKILEKEKPFINDRNSKTNKLNYDDLYNLLKMNEQTINNQKKMISAMQKRISFFENNSLYNEDCNDNNSINKFNEEELDSNSSTLSNNINNNNDTNSINSQDGNITITVDNKVIVLDKNKININRLLKKEYSDIIDTSGDLLFLPNKYKTRSLKSLNSFMCCDTGDDTMTNDQSGSSNNNVEGHSNNLPQLQQDKPASPISNSNSTSQNEKNSKYIKNSNSSPKEQNIPESKKIVQNDNKQESTNNENYEIPYNTPVENNLEKFMGNNNDNNNSNNNSSNNNNSYIKNVNSSGSSNSSSSKLSEGINDNLCHSTNLSKILLRNKTNLDENDLRENLIMKMDDIDTILNDNDDNSLLVTESSSLAKTIAELNNNMNNNNNNNSSNRMTASSIKSINNMCHNLMTNNNQKVVHIRNNKLLLENKELREKVRMLNEKLAYHQNSSKSLENLKKKLPPLKNANENPKCSEYGKQKKYSDIFKLPTIQNRSMSIVEVKDSNGSTTRNKSLPTKSKMPAINKKNNNVISNHNNKSFESPLEKINNNELKNTITNKTDSKNDLLSSSLSRNSSYYQKLYDSSKTMVKMDSDISRKNYKIKLKQDIENLDQEINNWS